MSLTIDFAPDEEARIRHKAATVGKDVATFVHDAALETADRPSLAQILAPIHQATTRTGVSVDEIDRMAERALEEVRSGRRAASSRESI
jgi:hypothetical protein